MTDRERLIELLSHKQQYGIATEEPPEAIYTIENHQVADHLLANGVIVPPVEVGQTVWILFSIEKTIESREVESIMRRQKSWTMRFTNGDCFTVWDNAEDEYFGKTVFLTKEEAEEKLKELKENGN